MHTRVELHQDCVTRPHTPAHDFARPLCCRCVSFVPALQLFEGGPQNRRSALKYVRKYADFFAELCLQEYTFQQYLPSVMAAAVVAAARRAVKIDPIWNPELEGLTTYNERQIFKAYKHLYNYYLESFPTAPHAFPSPKSVLDFEERAQQMPPALPVPVPALAHAPTQSQSAAF